MKHFSRRDFIHAGCTVAAASLIPPIVDVAEARMLRGSAPVVPSGLGKSVLNSNFGLDWYANLAKTMFSLNYGSNSITANLNSDGYPVGTLLSSIAGQMYFDSSYFGHYVFKWTGVGQFSFNTGDGIIVYSGGAGVYGITPTASGFYGGNSALVNNAALTTGMNVEFAWGTLITSVTTSGGWVKFGVTTNYSTYVAGSGSNPLALSSLVGNGTTTTVTTAAPHGFPTGVTIVMDILANTPGTFNTFGAVCTITGASTFTYLNSTNSTATGAGTYSTYSKNVQFNNLTGSLPAATTFKVWQSDASSLLVDQSAAYAGLVTVTGTGGPGTQTEVIISVGSGRSMSFPNTLPVYGAANYTMSNLIICKKADLTSIQAGNQISTDAINFVTAYKPRYIRYMDALSAQSYYSDFNYRMPITYLSFNPSPGVAPKIIIPSLVGTMTGTGDAVQVTNPGYQTGAYVDGEIVQWTCISSSTGPNSTIQLGSRGTVPLYTTDYCPFHITITGTITNGDIITTTFTASYLPGGVEVVSYTVNTGTNGPAGVKDTSLQNLRANLAANLGNDAVLSAYGFQFGNTANPGSPNLGNVSVTCAMSSGAVVITTSVTGTEVWTAGYYGDNNSGINGQASGTTYTGIYNAILQGFVIVNAGTSVAGGMPTGIPLEIIKELSTRCNVGAWFAMPFIYTPTSWNLLGAWAAANLPAGTPVICEYANEVWNTFAVPFKQVSNVGACVGLPFSSYFYCSAYTYYGAMVCSVLPNFVTGYTGAGGTRSNCSIALMARIDDISENPSNSCTVDYRLNGIATTASGVTFSGSISGTTLTVPAGYNGLIAPGFIITGAGVTANQRVVKQLTNSSVLGPLRGGTYQVTQSQTVGPVTMTPTNPVWTTVIGANYNAFPNRPVDICDTIGYAPYPTGGLIQATGSANFTGTQANFNNLFTASQNWGTGGAGPNPTAALQFIDDDFNLGINKSGSFNSYSVSGLTNAHANPGKCQTWETQIATYDGARPSGKANICVDQYEGGKEQSLVADHGNTDRAGAIAALTTQFNNNGWTLTAFGASNAAVATNITDLWLTYHGSTQYYNTVLTNWLGAMATIHAARPRFSPAQFGIEGISSFTTVAVGVPIWCVFSGDLKSQEMQNGIAMQYYNNH